MKTRHLTAATLFANLGVILWGAWVRASGSGAGCGNHWPLCNGQVVPRSLEANTLIEFIHRLTSGLAGLLVLAMVVMAFREYTRGHPARRWAVISLLFIVIEALLGAGLVKFGLVEQDASLARAIILAIHLANTLLLLAAITMTAWFADGRPAASHDRPAPPLWPFGIALAALLFLSMTGAIVSLGDTLFPSRTLAEGLAADADPTSHLLIRLRVWHPILAIVIGLGLITLVQRARTRSASPAVQRNGMKVIVLVVTQWTIGVSSLILLAPVPVQLLHLLVADFTWIALVWLTLSVRSDYGVRTSAATSRAASPSNTVPAPSSR